MRYLAAAARAALPLALFVALLTSCATAGSRPSTVAVFGVGVVQVEPDVVRMTISLSNTAPTTREAQAEVSAGVRQAREILLAAGVEERNIATAALWFSPEYEWLQAGGRRLVGQRVEQVISFSVASVGADGPASEIIDRLVGISGLSLQGMSFGVADTSELLHRARELAFQDALAKAEQYARLSGQRIARTLAVFEDAPAFHRQMPGAGAMRATAVEFAAVGDVGASLPAGEFEVSARVMVEFEMR